MIASFDKRANNWELFWLLHSREITLGHIEDFLVVNFIVIDLLCILKVSAITCYYVILVYEQEFIRWQKSRFLSGIIIQVFDFLCQNWIFLGLHKSCKSLNFPRFLISFVIYVLETKIEGHDFQNTIVLILCYILPEVLWMVVQFYTISCLTPEFYSYCRWFLQIS